MMMPGVEQALAFKVLGIQKRTGGAVPGDVMRSARLIAEGAGSKADVDKLRNYLGISKSGASAMTQGRRYASRQYAEVMKVGQALDAAQLGMPSGYAQLGVSAAAIAQQVAKSPEFQQALGKVFSDPVQGVKAGYAIARAAGSFRAAANYIPLIADAAGAAMHVDNVLKGNFATKATRLARENVAELEADQRVRWEDVRLAQKRATAQSIEDSNAGIPIIGAIAAHLNRKKYGVDAETLAKMETAKAIRDSGLGDIDSGKLLSTARKEALLSSGSMTGLMNKIGITTSELEQNTQSNIQERIARANEKKQAGIAAARTGNFELAQQYFNTANENVAGSVPVWMTPERDWKQQVMERGAQVGWARSQMARAGDRTGD